jgi:hypothetical protein
MTEPTIPSGIETWVDAIARVAGTIPGVKAVFSGGRGGLTVEDGDPRIQPMIAEELLVTPAAVIFVGDFEVEAGSWEKQRHDLQVLLWVPADPIATAYAEAISWPERVLSVFPGSAKVGEVHEHLQSVLVTGGSGIESRTWPEGSERRYLVRAINLEAELRRPAQYLPQ